MSPRNTIFLISQTKNLKNFHSTHFFSYMQPIIRSLDFTHSTASKLIQAHTGFKAFWAVSEISVPICVHSFLFPSTLPFYHTRNINASTSEMLHSSWMLLCSRLYNNFSVFKNWIPPHTYSSKKLYCLSFLSVPFSNQIHFTLLNLSSHVFNYHLDSNAFPNCKTGQHCVKCNWYTGSYFLS